MRLAADGATELCEVQDGFNRMATIVGHQRERLKIAAATDALTGLANHRHFQERLRTEVQEARENKTPLAVATIDIDGFKKLNDDRGHGRGDEALKLAGEAIERAVRGDDLVARLGGDDFMMILRGADPGYARDVSERARAAMARSLPEELELTVSAGFVCIPDAASRTRRTCRSSPTPRSTWPSAPVATRPASTTPRRFRRSRRSSSSERRSTRCWRRSARSRPVFQPLVELSTGRLIGFEALSRFNTDPRRTPDAWFNQAARCGRGLALEMAAIKAALSAPRAAARDLPVAELQPVRAVLAEDHGDPPEEHERHRDRGDRARARVRGRRARGGPREDARPRSPDRGRRRRRRLRGPQPGDARAAGRDQARPVADRGRALGQREVGAGRVLRDVRAARGRGRVHRGDRDGRRAAHADQPRRDLRPGLPARAARRAVGGGVAGDHARAGHRGACAHARAADSQRAGRLPRRTAARPPPAAGRSSPGRSTGA